MFSVINRSIDDRLARRKDGEKGFTLIELLVVVIIIGILAAIAIPVFLNQRQSAWKASVASDLKNAATVMETYGTQNNGSYAGFTTVAQTPTSTVFKISTGNTITVKNPTGSGYTLVGQNSNLTTSPNWQWYDSSTGGLKAWGAGTLTTVAP